MRKIKNYSRLTVQLTFDTCIWKPHYVDQAMDKLTHYPRSQHGKVDLRDINDAASKILVKGDRYPEKLEKMTNL